MEPVSAWYGYGVVIAGIVLLFAIRVPFARRAEAVPVAVSRRGALEVVLLLAVALGYLALPIVAIATPLLAFADYPLSPVALAAGAAALVVGLVVFLRAHRDLGESWSVTLELKERHRLVTTGVYARVRHPMYTALFLTAIAQALALPNWVAGPSYLVAFALMYVLRLGPEERMMRERFGEEYDGYARRTKRLIPYVL